MVAKATELIKAAKNPILLVGHAVQTSRGGEQVKALADLMACPVIQTSGGTAFIKGLEDRTFPYGFSKVANEAVAKSGGSMAGLRWLAADLRSTIEAGEYDAEGLIAALVRAESGGRPLGLDMTCELALMLLVDGPHMRKI